LALTCFAFENRLTGKKPESGMHSVWASDYGGLFFLIFSIQRTASEIGLRWRVIKKKA